MEVISMTYSNNYKNYSCGDVDVILQGLTKNKLIFTKHSFQRETLREINEKYIKDMIFNEDPLDIKQDKGNNEFKLYYPSETHSNKELIIVIAIDKDENVIIQSVWEEKRIN